MLKLFDNCSELKFGKSGSQVIGMISSEGESFDFMRPVVVEGPVERWMQSIEQEMQRTLFQKSKEGVFYYASQPRAKFAPFPSPFESISFKGGWKRVWEWSRF